MPKGKLGRPNIGKARPLRKDPRQKTTTSGKPRNREKAPPPKQSY